MATILEEKKRHILFGKLHFQNFLYKSKEGTDRELSANLFPVSFQEYLSMAQECYKNYGEPDNIKKMERSQIRSFQRFSIEKIKVEKQRAVILFDYINPSGAETAYKNQRTGRMRVLTKEKEEGVDYSAHMIIKFSDNISEAVFYACIEDIPGLPITVMNRLLSSLNQQILKYYKERFKIDDPTGLKEKNKIKKLAVRPQISFGTEPNEQIWNMLKNKHALCSLKVIKEEKGDFDRESGWESEREELYLSKPEDSFFLNPELNIKNLCKILNKKAYKILDIKLKDDNNKPRIVMMDTATTQLKTKRFVKSATIDICKKLSTGYDKIDDDVVNKMWERL